MRIGIKKVSVLMIIIFLICGLNYTIHINEKLFLNLKTYGYLGIFFACLLLNATVLLPSSSTAVVMSMATIYNPIIVAILGALGTTIGEFTGYFAGYYGRTLVEENDLFKRILNLYNKSPEIAIVIFAILPLPLFDVLGILSGSVRMNKKKFFILCFIGKTIKMMLYAYLGVYTLGQVKDFID